MTVELDEMWHFVQKKAKNAGYGLPGTEQGKRCLGVELGKRNKQTGQQLWEQLSLFEIDTVCSD